MAGERGGKKESGGYHIWAPTRRASVDPFPTVTRSAGMPSGTDRRAPESVLRSARLVTRLPIHLWLTATGPTLVSNFAYPDSCPKTCCKNGKILCYTTATALNPHEVDMYPRLVNLIRLVWLLAVAWYELGTFYHHTASCPWPDEHFATLVRSHLDTSSENSLKQLCMLSRTLPMYS